MSLGPHTIRVWRAGSSTEDDYHNPIPGPSESHDVSGCSQQPGAGSEYVIDRSATTTSWLVWAPATADVQDDDEVELAPFADDYASAKRYEINGPVDRWIFNSPLDHLVVPLKRTNG